MNQFIVLSLCVLAVTTTLDAAATKFTTKYDNVNLDEILANERLFNTYLQCILDKGKCTPDGQELKRAGVAVLAKAFNTFAILPPELQPVVNDLQRTITSEYLTEVDKFTDNRIPSKK